ncbi:MAG: hypothetical protein KatS3mg057_2115 [Herpetosiphonaceae bacterium]|nr:MAG: hypothetical protein KatS3mg057_2115 [Herpetosiphonaceae bacterium]
MTEFLQNLIGIGWLAVLIASVIKVTLILIVAPVMMMLLTWIERRAIAYMQDRRGSQSSRPLRAAPAYRRWC